MFYTSTDAREFQSLTCPQCGKSGGHFDAIGWPLPCPGDDDSAGYGSTMFDFCEHCNGTNKIKFGDMTHPCSYCQRVGERRVNE